MVRTRDCVRIRSSPDGPIPCSFSSKGDLRGCINCQNVSRIRIVRPRTNLGIRSVSDREPSPDSLIEELWSSLVYIDRFPPLVDFDIHGTDSGEAERGPTGDDRGLGSPVSRQTLAGPVLSFSKFDKSFGPQDIRELMLSPSPLPEHYGSYLRSDG